MKGFTIAIATFLILFILPWNAVYGFQGPIENKQDQNQTTSVSYFSLELSKGDLKNKAWFQFTENGEFGNDPSDAVQLTPLSSVYVLFASVLDESVSLDINNLPTGYASYVIDMKVVSTETGTHSISFADMQIPEQWTVELIDHEKGLILELGESYQFEVTNLAQKQVSTGKGGADQISVTSDPENRFSVRITTGEAEPENNGTLTGTEGWRLLANPVEYTSAGAFLDDIWTQGFSGADYEGGTSNVYTWSKDSTDSNADNWNSVTSADQMLLPGSGFLTYVYNSDNGPDAAGGTGFPKTLTVFGNIADTTLNLTSRLNSNTNGWTLLGNPFSEDIAWDKLARSNLSDAVYVYDGTTSAWKSWNGAAGSLTDGKIGRMNGFFVQTLSENPELIVADTAKIGDQGSFLGKENQNSGQADGSVFALKVSNEHRQNKAWFQFSSEGDMGQDVKDAWQLTPLDAEFVVLSSVLNDSVSLDINHLPTGLSSYQIDLNLRSTATVTHKFELSDTQLSSGWSVELIDHVTGEITNLNNPYIFELDANVEKQKTTVRNATAPVVLQSPPEIRFTIRVTAGETVSAEDRFIPEKFVLAQNYPNPFNPSTTIQYQLPEAADVRLEVFTILGQKVATLINESKTAGDYQVIFNTGNLTSGVYIYRIHAGNFSAVKQMVLVK